MKKSLLYKLTIYSLVIFTAAILSAVAICTVGNIRRTVTLTTDITKSANQIVSQLAYRYDMRKLAQASDSEEYQEFWAELRSICNSDGVEYVYIYIPDMDHNTATYVIGVASDERKSRGAVEKFQPGEVIDHSFSEGEKNAWDGRTEGISTVIDSPRYGKQMCTYALIKNQDEERVALVGATYSVDKIYKNIISDVALKMAKVFVVLAGIFIAAAFFIKKKIYDPITFLFHNMKAYVSEKADDNVKFEPVKLGTNDELQRLADYFNEMVVDMDHYAERVKLLAGQQAKAETELEVARRIQYGIVGEKKELCLADRFMISAGMKSARWVGGDFYDSFLLKNGNVCVFIGDVSGKGIAAALFMVYVKTLMREKLMDIPDIAQAVEEINREICHSNPEEMFATAFIAVFEQSSGMLQYVNAGHNKPVLVHSGRSEFLACDSGMALGVFDDSEYEQCEREFCSGDILYLYTDGVTEAIDSDKKFFGEERILGACNESENTANGVCGKIWEALKRFSGDSTEQFDDITMLAVERYDGELELACDLAELKKIKKSIWRLSVDDSMKKKIFLASEEIFSNIVNYSGAAFVRFCCNREAEGITVSFADNGKSFDPLERKQEKSFEEFDEGGMGIMLASELSSDISYRRIGAENILKLEFHK